MSRQIDYEYTGVYSLKYTYNVCLKCDKEFKVRIFKSNHNDFRFKRICDTCRDINKLIAEEDIESSECHATASNLHMRYGRGH